MDTPRVLVVGAGGIGCELLKTLVLSGFHKITVVDLDTIDKTNLNRQFLFKKEDIGFPKAEVAAKVITSYRPEVAITGLQVNVCELKSEFFAEFGLIFNALDNLQARRYVNRICVFLDKPLIDAGTKGKLGQVSVHLPKVTSCYDCEPKPLPKEYPVCTIRSKPDKPEHCIAWGKYLYEAIYGPEDTSNILSDIKLSRSSDPFQLFQLLFIENLPANANPLLFPEASEPMFYNENNPPTGISEVINELINAMKLMKDRPAMKFDKNDKAAVHFVAAVSNLRALNFAIGLKSTSFIQEVAGNIIPSIASTNSIIAALQVIEGQKLLRAQSSHGTVWLNATPSNQKLIVPSKPLLPSAEVPFI